MITRTRWMAMVPPFLALASAAALAGQGDLGGLEFRASILSPEVVREEPLLVRLELRNMTDQVLTVVAPYIAVRGWRCRAVTFTVAGQTDVAVPNGLDDPGDPYSARAFGWFWWADPGRQWVPKEPPPPSWPWALAPGAAAGLWVNLLQFYPIADAGRYHLTFRYAPRAAMVLSVQDKGPPPEGIWQGELEYDAGWVTVSEPDEADRAAADRLRRCRLEEPGRAISAAEGGFPAREFAEVLAGTVYEPYAMFYRVWGGGSLPGDEEALRAGYPNFPLLPLLDVLPGRRSVGLAKVHLRTAAWRLCQSFGDAGMSDERMARCEADVQQAVDELRAALPGFREAAVRTGDYSVAAEADFAQWYMGAWSRLCASQRGRAAKRRGEGWPMSTSEGSSSSSISLPRDGGPSLRPTRPGTASTSATTRDRGRNGLGMRAIAITPAQRAPTAASWCTTVLRTTGWTPNVTPTTTSPTGSPSSGPARPTPFRTWTSTTPTRLVSARHRRRGCRSMSIRYSVQHHSRLRRAVVTPVVIAPLALLIGASSADDLALSVSVWKREVIREEPILVKVELRNTGTETVAVVPPFASEVAANGPALGIAADRDSGAGDGAREEPPDDRRPSWSRGWQWWMAAQLLGGTPLPYPPRYVVPLAPGGAAALWLDLMFFHPIGEPGRYHLTFRYEVPAGTEAPPAGGDGTPVPAWSGALEADAGFVTVSEPGPDDQVAAELLGKWRRSQLGYVLASGPPPAATAVAVECASVLASTTYEPYAAMYIDLAQYPPGSLPWGAEGKQDPRPIATAADIAERYPDFPLNELLLKIAPAREESLDYAREDYADPAWPEQRLARLNRYLRLALDLGYFGAIEDANLRIWEVEYFARKAAEKHKSDPK